MAKQVEVTGHSPPNASAGEPRASGHIKFPSPGYSAATTTTASDPFSRCSAPGSLQDLLTMAAAALRAQLNTLVTSMFDTGMLDEDFKHLQSMEEDGSAAPGYVAEIINLFINNTNRILNDIAGLLNQPVVDFDMVDVLVRQLKGCSYSVGAKKVNLSCTHFRRFYEPRSKGRCLMALALVWNEFCDVRNKFETMMQLEEQIAAYGPK